MTDVWKRQSVYCEVKCKFLYEVRAEDDSSDELM